MSATQREASRKDYRVKDFFGNGTVEEINCGSLQRIADATEKMAASYDQLRADRDWWKARAKVLADEASCLRYSIRSLRGVITRLKKQGRSA